MKFIDVHAHALPESYLSGMRELGVNPIDEDGFPTPAWSEDAAIAFADDAQIGFSVLSISTPHIHRGDDAVAIKIARSVNDDLCQLCKRHPDRFGFAALLPLPSVEGSIAEANRAYDELGAIGVKVPSNANGVYLGDRSLDPLMESLNERAAVAIERYPNVKWVVPHCGSFLPEIAHRLIGISKILVPAGLMEPIDVEKNLKSLYFDLAGDPTPVMADALLKIADPRTCSTAWGVARAVVSVVRW